MRRLALLVTVVTLIGAVVAAPPASATDFTTIPIQETGVVDWVSDGDTFRFVEDGQSAKVSVRMLGINTPEVAGFQNEHFPFDFCGGIAAQTLLKQLLPVGTRVQLRAQHQDSTNRGRILRSVFRFNEATGQYDIDVQAQMAQSGLAMWFTLEDEPARSDDYRPLVTAAQSAGLGIWNPGMCGPIEQPEARISLTPVWDAPENDAANVNGEYVIVRNVGATPVDLTGWLLRDSSLEAWFTFPGGSVLAPDDYRVVHVGQGTGGQPNPRDLYMGSAKPIFPNVRTAPLIGDGVYLLDRNTAYRSWFEYPCVANCTDPLKGKVIISKVNAVTPPGPASKRANAEFVQIKNVSRTPVRLDGYFLRRQISTYALAPGTVIAPGRTLTVRIGKGRPTATTQYWGRASTLLNDQRDSVQLRSPANVLVSEKRWGDGPL